MTTPILQYQQPGTALTPPIAVSIVFWSLIGLASATLMLPLLLNVVSFPPAVLLSLALFAIAYGMHRRSPWVRTVLAIGFVLLGVISGVAWLLGLIAILGAFVEGQYSRAFVACAVIVLTVALEAGSIYLFMEFVDEPMRHWMQGNPRKSG